MLWCGDVEELWCGDIDELCMLRATPVVFQCPILKVDMTAVKPLPALSTSSPGCSPKCAESLKEIQKVLDLPELKIVKTSDTCWLAD